MRTATKIAIGAAALGAVLLPVAFVPSVAKAIGLRAGYVPARDMTRAEALDALQAFQDASQISYQPTPSDPRYVDLSASLDGVQYQYAGSPLAIHHVTPQFAVFLVRLAQVMRKQFGAVAIEHMGIYPGRGSGNDVHNRGAAIDVSAIDTIPNGRYSVYGDWGSKPKLAPGYRLQPSSRAYAIFRSLYDFAAHEAEDDPGGDHRRSPSQIGDHSMIVSPDHPDAALAAEHRDHVHIQIGPTLA